MATLDDLLRPLAAITGGVPEFIAKPALANAVNEFCLRALVWQRDIKLNNPGKVNVVPLEPHGQPHRVIAAAISHEPLADYEYSWTGTAIELQQPLPHHDYHFVVAYKPVFASEHVPDDVLEYAHAIVKYAAAELGKGFQKPWSLPGGHIDVLMREFSDVANQTRHRMVNHAHRVYSPPNHQFF